MEKIKVLELFGGIRAPHKALLNLAINIETIDYVEYDKKVVDIANKMYDTNYEPKSVVGYSINKQIDLLIGGVSCQDFSNNGLNKGGIKNSGTRSSLIWEQLRILKETMPKYYILENVKGIISKKHLPVFLEHNKYIEELGYKVYWKVINAKDFGIPQNRERVFVIAIRNDLKQEFNFNNLKYKKLRFINKFLYKDIDSNYFLKTKDNKVLIDNGERFIMSDKSTRPLFKESENGIITLPLSKNFTSNKVSTGRKLINTLTTQSNNKILVECELHDRLKVKWNNKLWNIRKLTELESFLLMGFTKEDFNKASSNGTKRSMLYHVAGNSIVVQVLEAIFKELIKK